MTLKKIPEYAQEALPHNGIGTKKVLAVSMIFGSLFALAALPAVRSVSLLDRVPLVAAWLPMVVVFSAVSYALFLFTISPKREPSNSTISIFSLKLDDSKRTFWAMFVVLIATRIPYLIIYWPGIILGDTWWQLGQINNPATLSDHHPLFSTELLNLFMHLGKLFNGGQSLGFGLFAVAQVLFTSLILAYAFKRLFAWRTPRSLIILLIISFTVLHLHNAWAVAIDKDVIFSFAVLLFVIATIDIVKDPKGYFRYPLHWVIVIGSCALIMLMRHNGIYLLAPAFFALALTVKPLRKSMLVSVLVCAALFFGMNWFIVDVLHVAPGPQKEMLSVPIDQIARVSLLHSDGFTPDETEAVSKLFGGASPQKVGSLYDPVITDHVKDLFSETYYQANKQAFVKTYVELGKRYPLEYARSFLLGCYSYAFPGAYISYVPDYAPDYAARYTSIRNRLKDRERGRVTLSQRVRVTLYDTFDKARSIFPLSMLTGLGMAFWIAVFALATLFLKRRTAPRACVACFVAPFFLWLTCLASPVNGEFRYIYGLVLAAPVLLAFALRPNLAEQDPPQPAS